MAEALKLEVILESIDKMTAPVRSALGASKDLDNQVADLRKQLLTLNKTQKDMTAFKELKVKSTETGAALEKAKANAKKLALQLKNNKVANQGLAESLALAQKRTEQLGLKLSETEEPSKALNKEFREAQALTNKLTAQFRMAESATGRLSTRFDSAKNSVNKLKNKQTEEIRSLDQLRAKFKAAGISSKQLQQAQKDIATQTTKATQALDAQAQKLKQLQSQQKAMRGLSFQRNRSMQMASNMTVMGAGGVATGRQATMAALAPAGVAMDFEEQMSRVQALTRLNKGNPEQAAKIAALRQQALDLGSSTSFSASESAGAQSFLAMAGFDPDKIMKAMPGMLSLAKAAGAELAQTADISSNILSGFRLEADQMGRVGDVLTATFTRSNVDLSMLGEAMKYAAPVAAELNVSLEETAAMAGLLGNVGIQASMAGTSMRAIFNRMSSPPKAAREALEDISVKTTDAAGNMRSVPEILAEIAQKTEKMGNAQRMAIFKAVAGAEAGSAMATLVAQEGAEGITKFTEVLKDSAGEADRVAKVMGDNSKGLVKEAQSAYEGLQITLGGMLQPTINAVVLKVTELTRSVQTWAQENPALASGIMKVAVGLGIIMAIMGGLTMAVAAVLGPMILMKFLLGAIGIKMGLGALTLGKLASGFMIAARAIGFMSMMLMANPIVLIIAAIAAAAYLIYRNWGTVKQWILTFWDAIKPYFQTVWSWLKTLWNWSPLGLVVNNWGTIVTWFKGLPECIKAALSSLAGIMLSIGKNIMESLATGIKNKAKAVMGTVTKFASDVTSKVKGVFGINSPSRVFRHEIGGNIAESTGLGIQDKQTKVMQVMHKFGKVLPVAAVAGMSMATPAAAQIQSIQKAQNKPAPINTQQSSQTTQQIEININAAPGMDEHHLAELVEQKLRALQHQQSENRSGYLFDGADR